ncbi:MAG: hypothetical protein AB1630_08735 [bacterium]
MTIGILGVCLTVLGIILAYIWKGNQKMEKAILASQEAVLASQEAVLASQERLEEGQKKGFAILEEGQKVLVEGQREIAQMLLNQTKILERIEGKIPTPSPA